MRHPAVLVEGGFLTNKEDVDKLANDDYREQMAVAISEGVVRYREIFAAGENTARRRPSRANEYRARPGVQTKTTMKRRLIVTASVFPGHLLPGACGSGRLVGPAKAERPGILLR